MNQVSPMPNINSNILFENLGDNPGRCFIIMYGLGSPGTELGDPVSTPTGKYILLPYNSDGIVLDALNVVKDIGSINKGRIISSRKTRLLYTIDIIKSKLMEETNEEVILIGLSHGSLILFSALTCIEADSTVNQNLLKKLRFFAISPPTILPPNLLSYNKVPLVKKTHKTFDVLSVPPYIQVQYIDDNYFNNPVLKRVLTKINTYYIACSALLPNNKLFSYDIDKNILMLRQLSTDSPNYGDVYRGDNVGDFRYEFAKVNVTKPMHANIAFMYPFINFYEMSLNISEMNRDFEQKNPSIFSKIFGKMNGGGGRKINILGRSRIVITKGRWQYVRYQNELITINKAKILEKKLHKKH